MAVTSRLYIAGWLLQLQVADSPLGPLLPRQGHGAPCPYGVQTGVLDMLLAASACTIFPGRGLLQGQKGRRGQGD